MKPLSRRALLGTSTALLMPWFSNGRLMSSSRPTTPDPALYPAFPAQDPKRVQEMVGASHGRIEVVQRLLKESPALAKATIDWGFGDWETAIGAASHVGNREIASVLMEHGARPDLFTFAMLGNLEVVQAYVKTNPGIQRLRGPHGFTLLHHAKQGGKNSEPVVAYLEELGDADIQATSLTLGDEEKQKCVGTYRLEGSEDDVLEVAVSRMSRLTVKRNASGSPRNLNYLGNNEFSPVGSEAVRVRFSADYSECSIVDGPMSVTARRT